MREVYTDTSVLQYFHQLGRLELLRHLYGQVIVPNAVAAELAAGHRQGIELPDLAAIDWIAVRAGGVDPEIESVRELGDGERAVLTLARRSANSLALLDDRFARTIADAYGIRKTGTLGVLMRAKQRGDLDSVQPELDRLEALGFRLDPGTRATVLSLAGE